MDFLLYQTDYQSAGFSVTDMNLKLDIAFKRSIAEIQDGNFNKDGETNNLK